jgi:hypothetical protein
MVLDLFFVAGEVVSLAALLYAGYLVLAEAEIVDNLKSAVLAIIRKRISCTQDTPAELNDW